MSRLLIISLAGLTVGIGACEVDRRGEEIPATEEPTQEPVVEEQFREADEPGEAMALVDEALGTLRTMQEDAELWNLARTAQGVFIIPRFGRAAAGVGVRGGEGVLMARTGDSWSGPAFYDLGAVSVGAQVGAAGGEIAMILVTPATVESFKQENNFSINADAGLVVLDYSALAEATAGRGDVIMWSDTEGAFAGVALGVSDIDFDEEESAGYYEQQVSPTQIVDGTVSSPRGDALKNELSGGGR